MKVQYLLPAFLLFFCTTATFGQSKVTDQSFKKITLAGSSDSVFDKTIDYLQANDLFIRSVDKQAGFIQVMIFLKARKKILSAKEGERRTMNFILRAAGDQTRVVLNIYSEEYYFGGEISPRTYYYMDKGIMDDPTVYRDILSGLQKSVNGEDIVNGSAYHFKSRLLK